MREGLWPMPASEGSLLGKTMEFGAYGVLGGALWGAIDAGMRDPVPGAPLRGAVARMGLRFGRERRRGWKESEWYYGVSE